MTHTATRPDIKILDLPPCRGRRLHCECGATFLLDSMHEVFAKRGGVSGCRCEARLYGEIYRPTLVERTQRGTLYRHDQYLIPLFTVGYRNADGDRVFTHLLGEDEARGMLCD